MEKNPKQVTVLVTTPRLRNSGLRSSGFEVKIAGSPEQGTQNEILRNNEVEQNEDPGARIAANFRSRSRMKICEDAESERDFGTEKLWNNYTGTTISWAWQVRKQKRTPTASWRRRWTLLTTDSQIADLKLRGCLRERLTQLWRSWRQRHSLGEPISKH